MWRSSQRIFAARFAARSDSIAAAGALYATDGSNYRQPPIGVVIPRNIEDVERALAICRVHGAPVFGRGGGTSLAGQCCNVAVCFDMSKYLNRVLSIDASRRLGRVEPGTILDDLLVKDIESIGYEKETLQILPEGKGWLLVEFGGETKADADAHAHDLMTALQSRPNPPSMKLFDDPAQEKKVWKVREAGLGATAHVDRDRPTWEGWEDSAVPPERLGEYLRRRFRDLLKQHDLHGDLYGHFSQGCVHTRIDFDLETAAGSSLIITSNTSPPERVRIGIDPLLGTAGVAHAQPRESCDANAWVVGAGEDRLRHVLKVMETLVAYARRQQLRGSQFTAIGAFSEAVVAYFDWDSKALWRGGSSSGNQREARFRIQTSPQMMWAFRQHNLQSWADER